MAKSAALGFTLAGVGTVAIISGIQGKSIAQVFKGEIGEAPNPAFKGEGETGQSEGSEGKSAAEAAGLVSPFPKGTAINWGRTDQGIDGKVPPGTPLRAIGNGTVHIAHNCSGFGCNYPVLDIEGHRAIYYGHVEPTVPDGTVVKKGQIIGKAHINHVWGNSTEPGGFEFGQLGPNGEYPQKATGAFVSWFQHLMQI